MAKDFDELLSRLPEIAKAVNEFSSPELQTRAFDALMATAGVGRTRNESAAAGGHAPPVKEPSKQTTSSKPPSKKPAGASPSRRQGDQYQIVEIDLHPKDKESLEEFILKKSPKSDPEKYTCIIYYLNNTIGVSNITVDHIYTAYKQLRLKVPNIRSGLNNVRSRHGWVSYKGRENISLTRIGENIVEHQLPSKNPDA